MIDYTDFSQLPSNTTMGIFWISIIILWYNLFVQATYMNHVA